jgi:hypothetical protein
VRKSQPPLSKGVLVYVDTDVVRLPRFINVESKRLNATPEAMLLL